LNKSRYQKKGKNRNSNRVCGKNEKDPRESRNSIEKSLEEDKVASVRMTGQSP